MQLLIFTHYFWPENFRINDLTLELLNRGHKVTIVTGMPNYPSGKIFPEFKSNPNSFNDFNGANVIRVPVIPRGNGSIKLALNYLSFMLTASSIGIFRLRRQNFDAVFVFAPSPVTVCFPAVLYRYLNKIPTVIWVLDLWPNVLKDLGVVSSKRVLNIVEYFVSFIYNQSDLILGQSRSFITNIKKLCRHNQIKYFPGWAESVFTSGRINGKSKDIDDTFFNVVFTGNMGESQDFPAILNAAEKLKDNKFIKWTIVGDGRMFQWVKSQIEKRNLSDNILLAGHHPIEKMTYFFSKADALLVSLKDEPIFSNTIPGKFQAYLKAGKPIVGMINGECAELIKTNNCGIVSKAGDGKELANSLIKLSQMAIVERKQMGNMSLNLSKTEFDRTKLIDQLEEWLGQLVRKSD